MPCYSPLKGYKDKEGGLVFRRAESAGAPMDVACGQCLGCRSDRAELWAIRIMHEATQWPENWFVTLTYRSLEEATIEQYKQGKVIPADGSLNKKHFQDFMKRLRKSVFPGRQVRYYHCGEYGNEFDRPHYHACLFNTQFSDLELVSARSGRELFTSRVLEDCWGFGFVTLGRLTHKSAAYVARYCLKKITGDKADDHYLRCDENGVAYWLQPEYSTMSRRPGIGAKWMDKYKDDVFPADECPVIGESRISQKVPKFYEQWLSEEELEEIKAKRQAYRDSNPEEFTSERLYERYQVKKASVGLNRSVL